MSLTVAQWHQRFTQQATWTRQLRSYLYSQAGLKSNCRVLEVGCGTGALAADFSDRELVTYIGLDVDFSRLFLHKAPTETVNSCRPMPTVSHLKMIPLIL